MKGIISLDWLSINVKNKYDSFELHSKYEVKNTGIHTRHFNFVDDMLLDGEKVATLTHGVPANSVIPQSTIQVKFDNSFLYELNLFDRVNAFLDENNLVFKSFSRIDVCYDFNTLSNGWTGGEFVRRYTNELIERKAHGHFTLSGRKGDNGRRYNYLAFGSRKSDLRLYFYDKTLELEEKKSKPYIKKLWENNGLDIESVWRIEFSVTCFNRQMTYRDSGEVAFDMKTLHCIKEQHAAMLFKYLYFKYMFFYKTCQIKKSSNITRDAKRIILIKEFEEGKKLDWLELRETESSGRTEKIILKRINEHYNEVWNKKNDSPASAAYVHSVKTYLDNHVKLFNLEQWSQRKLPDYNPHTEFDEETQRQIDDYIYKLIHTKSNKTA